MVTTAAGLQAPSRLSAKRSAVNALDHAEPNYCRVTHVHPASACGPAISLAQFIVTSSSARGHPPTAGLGGSVVLVATRQASMVGAFALCR